MKKLLIPFIVFLYLSQTPTIIGFSIALAYDLYVQDIWYVFLISLLFGITATIFGLAILVFGFINIAKPRENVHRDTMITKITLMPFFIINFYMCAVAIGAMANPFLMIGIPFIFVISVLLTFFSMFATSMYNIGFMIYQLRTRHRTFEQLLAHILLEHVFVFDVISALVLYIQERRASATISLSNS